jgi:TPR repeat protein
MITQLEPESSKDALINLLETGSDEELANAAGSLFAAAEDDPGFANIAADWLQYGRYGVGKDEKRAALFRAKAVDALIPDAVYDHALILEGGDEDGAKKALPYYILAAALGDPDAMSALSEYFLYGEGVEVDYFVAGALTKHANLIRPNGVRSRIT